MSVDTIEATSPPADHRIPYGIDPFQFCDLRVPDKQGPHPVAVMVHGGFWRSIYGLKYLGHICAAQMCPRYFNPYIDRQKPPCTITATGCGPCLSGTLKSQN